MTSRRKAWLFAMMLLTLAACGWFKGDDRVVEVGECCGVQIGQSKADVLAALKVRGVTSVIPDERRSVSASAGSIDNLLDLRSESAVCVRGEAGYQMTLSFGDGGLLEYTNLSPAARGKTLGIAVGQPRAEVFAKLREALLTQRGLRAYNCFHQERRPRWIDLSGLGEPEVKYLSTYDTWLYQEPTGHSHARLVFMDERLIQIQYHNRKYEES